MKTFSKLITATLFVLLNSQGLFAQSVNKADAVLGIFQSPEGDRKIEIYKDNNQYVGKLVAITAANGKAKVGTIILKGFTYSKGTWQGKVCLPARNAEYPATLTLPDAATLTIKVKAGFLSQAKNWARIKP